MPARIGRNLRYVGNGMLALGVGCFVIASIVGILAIDIVILAALSKQSREGRGSPFLTGFLLGQFFRPGSYWITYSSAGGFFISSLVTTAVACVLAVVLSVPYVAALLALVWGAAAAVTLLGLGMVYLGEKLSQVPDEPAPPGYPPDNSSSAHMKNMPTCAPVPVPVPPTHEPGPTGPDPKPCYFDNKTGERIPEEPIPAEPIPAV